MEEFFTRDTANEGKRVPLFAADGSPTEHWLHVRSMQSDAFRIADNRAKRAILQISQIEDPAERAATATRLQSELIASLIADWSFDKECTLENVVEFLTKAPQIEDMVNQLAASKTYFYAKKSTSSTDGSAEK